MAQSGNRVKISDIAARAGVSTGTVDRVIHNRGEVAPKTRARIQKFLREMEYETDILASTLASKKTYRFIALLPEASHHNPFWVTPIEGLDAALGEIKHFGITLEKLYFSHLDRNDFVNKLKQIIKTKPSGVILVPVFTEPAISYTAELAKLDIPVVCLNANIAHPNIAAFVGQDSFQSGMVAAQLFDFGLNCDAEIYIINIVNDKGDNGHILEREKGFRQYYTDRITKNKRSLTTIKVNPLETGQIGSFLQDTLGKRCDPLPRRGIFVTNSKVFHIAAWLQQTNQTNYILIGYDLVKQNLEFLRGGVIDFLLSQQPYNQGYKSVMALFNILVTKKNIVKYQYLPIDIISKENIDFYKNY